MDRAAEEAERGAVDGTVVLCDRQTQGRGRFNRNWVSPSGNLILSVVLRPSLEALPYVSVLAALAVVRAVEKETNLDPVIKWPNDVLVRGRKLCGLLVENSLQGRKVRHAIVGIGLNVDLDPRENPEIADTATSLRLKRARILTSARCCSAFSTSWTTSTWPFAAAIPHSRVGALPGNPGQASPSPVGCGVGHGHGGRCRRPRPPASATRQRRVAYALGGRSYPEDPVAAARS